METIQLNPDTLFSEDLPDSKLDRESLKKDIDRILLTLTPQQSEIIKYYFGIEEEALNLVEIGEKFNLTRERARQIKEKSIRRMKHYTRCNLLRKYL